jgi:hypothetical protein
VYPQLTCRQFAVRPLDSSNALQVIASYIYNQVSVDSTVWTVSSSTYTEMLDTDQQWSAATATNGSNPTLVPISISNFIQGWSSFQTSGGAYNPPPIIPHTGGSPELPQPPAYGVVQAAKVRKRWDYTQTIYSPTTALSFDAATLNYVNCINSTPFLGVSIGGASQNLNLPTGTVYCYSAGCDFSLASGQYIAQCTLIYKPEGWQPWARYTNVSFNNPVPPNIWRPGMLGATAYAGNGTTMALEYLSTDLNALLALL